MFWGQGGSLGKALALQTQEPEHRFPEPTQRPSRRDGPSAVPVLRSQRTDPQNKLAG